MSMSQAQVHMWPNFGEISLKNYEDIVSTQSSGSMSAVTLTFDLWSQKLISTTNPNKLGEISFIGVHKVFGSLTFGDLDLGTLTPKS